MRRRTVQNDRAREQWSAIRSGLRRAIESGDAHRQFQVMRAERALLQPFATPHALLDWLHGEPGCLDRKDEVYRLLVQRARAGDPDAQTAWTLILLGLWPSFDRTFGELLRFGFPPDDVPTAILAGLTALIERYATTLAPRLTATLTRSTRRNAISEFKKEAKAIAASDPVPAEDGSTGSFPASLCCRSVHESSVDGDHIASILGDNDDLEDTILAVAGKDAPLVIGAALYGASQKALAEELGISHSASRKRYRRAVVRVRRALSSRALSRARRGRTSPA